MENQRAVTLLFLVGGLTAGDFCRRGIEVLLAYRVWEDPVVVGIAPASSVFGLVAGALTFVFLLRHTVSREFVDSVVAELKKVAWPSREETFNNTSVVVASAVAFALLLGLYDFTWARVTGLVLYSGG